MKKFRRVAVLMGGPSAERGVSLESGQAVAAGLREAGYDVAESVVEGRRVDLPAGVEAVFIAMHGEFGEDGGVQELLDARGIPYTGSGAAASRCAMDKVATKRLFEKHGVPTASYEVLRASQPRRLPLPVVVKPPRQGSSIGISVARTADEWTQALAEGFKYDSELLVEAFVEGRELTVGIVDGQVLPLVEIVPPGGQYTFEIKYNGASRYLVPAPVDGPAAAACRQAGLRTYEVLGCRGMGRVDVRLTADGQPFVLEMNTIPGFTRNSLLPKAAAAAGIGFAALCDRILMTARCGS